MTLHETWKELMRNVISTSNWHRFIVDKWIARWDPVGSYNKVTGIWRNGMVRARSRHFFGKEQRLPYFRCCCKFGARSNGQISVIGLLMWRLIDHHKKQDHHSYLWPLPYPCRSDSSVYHKLDSEIIKNSNSTLCSSCIQSTTVQTAPEKVKKFFSLHRHSNT